MGKIADLMLRIISGIVNSGVKKEYGDRANARIKLVNRISLIFSVISILQSPIFFLLTDSIQIFIVSVLIGLGFQLSPLLNSFGKTVAAKIVFTGYVCMANIYFTQSMENEKMGQMLCFALISLPAMFFEKEKTVWKWVCYFFPVLTFLCLEFIMIFPRTELQSVFYPYLKWSFILIVFTLSILSVNGFSKDVNILLGRLEDLLVDSQKKNNKLMESQILLNKSREEMVSTNKELIQYKKNLEKMVKERTIALDQTIKELEQSQEDLKKAKDEAIKANQAKTEFLANMSHEIRSPLNAILGFSQILSMESGDRPIEHDFLEILSKIKISGENLSELINNILDLSKIEAGKMVLNEEPVNLKQLVKSIYQINKGRAEEKRVQFKYTYDERIPEQLLLDRTKVNQVLMNLVTNAIKFTNDNKEVLLEAGLESQKIILRVMDQGIGIPKEMMEQIFQPFVQADGSITRRFGGTGLGLSIVDKMVTMMRGSVHVESVSGIGSTFEVRIPLRVMETTENQSKEIRNKIGIKPGVKVLLVEDNLLNQEVMKRYLKINGCHVKIASNGKEGLKYFQLFSPHIVLMDLHMPVMDGLEATREIRKLGDSQVPIIVISADAFAEQRKKAYKAGCSSYITKPIDFESLNEIFEKYLPRFYQK